MHWKERLKLKESKIALFVLVLFWIGIQLNIFFHDQYTVPFYFKEKIKTHAIINETYRLSTTDGYSYKYQYTYYVNGVTHNQVLTHFWDLKYSQGDVMSILYLKDAPFYSRADFIMVKYRELSGVLLSSIFVVVVILVYFKKDE